MYFIIQTSSVFMVAIDTPGGPLPAGPVPEAETMSFCPHQDLATRPVRSHIMLIRRWLATSLPSATTI